MNKEPLLVLRGAKPRVVLQFPQDRFHQLEEWQKNLVHRVMNLVVDTGHFEETSWNEETLVLMRKNAQRDIEHTRWSSSDGFANALQAVPQLANRYHQAHRKSQESAAENIRRMQELQAATAQVNASLFMSISGAPCPSPSTESPAGRYEQLQELQQLHNEPVQLYQFFVDWLLEEVSNPDSNLPQIFVAQARQQEAQEFQEEIVTFDNGYITIDPLRMNDKDILITISGVPVKITKNRSGKLHLTIENWGIAMPQTMSFQMYDGCLKILVPEEGTISVKNEYVHSKIISIHPETNGQEGQEED